MISRLAGLVALAALTTFGISSSFAAEGTGAHCLARSYATAAHRFPKIWTSAMTSLPIRPTIPISEVWSSTA